MSYATIRKLLETRLNAVGPSIKTGFENSPVKPTVGVPYQRVTLMPADTESPTLPADGFRREMGYLQVDLAYPENAGAAAAVERAEAIRSQFPRALVLVEGGVRVYFDREVSLGRGYNEGGFYRLPVFVYYRADVAN